MPGSQSRRSRIRWWGPQGSKEDNWKADNIAAQLRKAGVGTLTRKVGKRLLVLIRPWPLWATIKSCSTPTIQLMWDSASTTTRGQAIRHESRRKVTNLRSQATCLFPQRKWAQRYKLGGYLSSSSEEAVNRYRLRKRLRSDRQWKRKRGHFQ